MQYYTSATTLGAPSKPVEVKIPLWWTDGTSASATNWALLNDGSTSTTAPVTSFVISNKLHTLSSKWPSGTQFALEVTLWGSSTSTTYYAQLYDLTSSATGVSGSMVSTTSTTATVLRTGQFTLTDGHVYGVGFTPNSTSYTAYISDASLIIFP